MRLKCLTIFFAVLAAASLPRTAYAQDFAYDSYGVYDPNSKTDWDRGPANGALPTDGAKVHDKIGGEAAGYTPPATCNFNSTKVEHWAQQWSIGSTTSGAGALVQTDTLQKYIGHADHL